MQEIFFFKGDVEIDGLTPANLRARSGDNYIFEDGNNNIVCTEKHNNTYYETISRIVYDYDRYCKLIIKIDIMGDGFLLTRRVLFLLTQRVLFLLTQCGTLFLCKPDKLGGFSVPNEFMKNVKNFFVNNGVITIAFYDETYCSRGRKCNRIIQPSIFNIKEIYHYRHDYLILSTDSKLFYRNVLILSNIKSLYVNNNFFFCVTTMNFFMMITKV